MTQRNRQESRSLSVGPGRDPHVTVSAMSPSIEVRDIHVFLVLADELHFGRTAERLGLTSSRVSQVLQRIERTVRGQLVHRTSRRVELTALGERFRRDAASAYSQVLLLVEQTRAAAGGVGGTVRLGLFTDPAASRIPSIVRSFEQSFPGCVVEASEVPINDPFGPLKRGETDLVASWLPHGQSGLVTGTILSSEPRVLAVGCDHPLADRDHVSLEDLADYKVPRFDTMPKEFHDVWIPRRTHSGRPIRHHPFSTQSLGDRGRMTSELVFLVATGKIVHPTVPSFAHMFGHPDIVYVPIVDLAPLRSALVWRRGLTNDAAREFIRIARDLSRTPRPGERGGTRRL